MPRFTMLQGFYRVKAVTPPGRKRGAVMKIIIAVIELLLPALESQKE